MSESNMNNAIERLSQSFEMLGLMVQALQHLRIEVLPKNGRMFALMAEGPLEEMRRLQADIQDLMDQIAHQ